MSTLRRRGVGAVVEPSGSGLRLPLAAASGGELVRSITLAHAVAPCTWCAGPEGPVVGTSLVAAWQTCGVVVDR